MFELKNVMNLINQYENVNRITLFDQLRIKNTLSIIKIIKINKYQKKNSSSLFENRRFQHSRFKKNCFLKNIFTTSF